MDAPFSDVEAISNASIDSPMLSAEVDLVPFEIETFSLRTGNTDVVATQPFRKCSITTKVTDLQHCYFVDGRTEKKRDACVVFLQFLFARQKQGGHFNQRITEMTVAIRAERDGQMADAPPPYTEETLAEHQLAIRAVHPRVAVGPAGNRSVKTSLGANLSPEAGGISLGGADIRRETSYEIPHRQSLKVSLNHRGEAILDLQENKLYHDGIPDIVDCAILLQTDGLPFTLGLGLFGQTPFAGIRVTGSVDLRIGQKYLWTRPRKTEGAQGSARWKDVDSDEFLEWVKSKTVNGWAEDSRYDMA